MGQSYNRGYVGNLPSNNLSGIWKPQDVIRKQKEKTWNLNNIIQMNPYLLLDSNFNVELDSFSKVFKWTDIRNTLFLMNTSSANNHNSSNIIELNNGFNNSNLAVEGEEYYDFFCVISIDHPVDATLFSMGTNVYADQQWQILRYRRTNPLIFTTRSEGDNTKTSSPINLQQRYLILSRTNPTSFSLFVNAIYANFTIFRNTQPIINSSFAFNPWIGTISDLIIFKRNVSDLEKEIIEGHLAHKNNLQSFLPTTHPYKTNRPFTYMN